MLEDKFKLFTVFDGITDESASEYFGEYLGCSVDALENIQRYADAIDIQLTHTETMVLFYAIRLYATETIRGSCDLYHTFEKILTRDY